MRDRPDRYTGFQRKVLEAVSAIRDPLTIDVACRVGATARHTQRTLNLLVDRGQITGGYREGPWHLTAKGARRLRDWGTGL